MKFTLSLVVAVVAARSACDSASSDRRTLYISPKGSDTRGDGTKSKPLYSVNGACRHSKGSSLMVHASAGTYPFLQNGYLENICEGDLFLFGSAAENSPTPTIASRSVTETQTVIVMRKNAILSICNITIEGPISIERGSIYLENVYHTADSNGDTFRVSADTQDVRHSSFQGARFWADHDHQLNINSVQINNSLHIEGGFNTSVVASTVSVLGITADVHLVAPEISLSTITCNASRITLRAQNISIMNSEFSLSEIPSDDKYTHPITMLATRVNITGVKFTRYIDKSISNPNATVLIGAQNLELVRNRFQTKKVSEAQARQYARAKEVLVNLQPKKSNNVTIVPRFVG